MKKALLFAVLLIASIQGFGQCPTTTLYLTSQAEVDTFAATYPGCTDLEFQLSITGPDITDLSGLSQIQSVGNLSINDNPLLTNVNGLQNITITSASLTVSDNPQLVSIEGLLANHTDPFDVWISDNANLDSLIGLEGLTVLSTLYINNNDSLVDLDGLQNITMVETQEGRGDRFNIHYNDNLQTFSGFQNVLVKPGLNAGRSTFDFRHNPLLTTMEGFLAPGSEAYVMYIDNNASLLNLSGFENLVSMEYLIIINNEVINSIDSIENAELLIGGAGLIIGGNSLLSVCDIDLVCDYLNTSNPDAQIYDNAPGCNSVSEVEAQCLLSISEVDLNTAIGIYPNPASENISINVSESVVFEEALVYSILGERVLVTSEKSIDVSNLSEGIYFIEVVTNQGRITKKIVKE